MSTPLQIKTSLKIQKSIHDVFEAIINPEKMTNYFISKSSGVMIEGTSVRWQFPEMDLEFPVQVLNVKEDESILFSWESLDNHVTEVMILLKAMSPEDTFVTITEGNRENNEAGINWLKDNTAGWANFLASMKAYLEYGINLRKGAFDISQMPTEINAAP